MDRTPHERLPFPEANDPGNGALDLQVLAEAIDAKAQAQLTDLRRIVNRPMRFNITNANGPFTAVPNAYSDIFTLSAGNWTNLINTPSNFSFDSTDMTGGMGTGPGVYRLGVCVLSNPVGAVNAGTLRAVRLTATIPTSDFSAFPTLTVIKRSFSNAYETSVGIVDIQCELEFATPNPSSTVLDAEFFHSNTSSNVQLMAGTISYLYRVGDVDI